MDRIVVGVDHGGGVRAPRCSGPSDGEAHAGAVPGAASREAVHAWHRPGYVRRAGPFCSAPWTVPGVAVRDPPYAWHFRTFRRRSRPRRWLDRCSGVADVDTTGLAAPIEGVLVCDGAAHALLHAAKDADLLVVGSRGARRVRRSPVGLGEPGDLAPRDLPGRHRARQPRLIRSEAIPMKVVIVYESMYGNTHHVAERDRRGFARRRRRRGGACRAGIRGARGHRGPPRRRRPDPRPRHEPAVDAQGRGRGTREERSARTRSRGRRSRAAHLDPEPLGIAPDAPPRSTRGCTGRRC